MPRGTASRIATVGRVYLIVALFVAIILGLVLNFQFQMDTAVGIRVFVGGEGLWAKAQKDAMLRLGDYASSGDEAEYQAYLRLIQVPLGYKLAREEMAKPRPNLDIARAGCRQGGMDPVDIEYALSFFLRFQDTDYMALAIGHWRTGDRLVAELMQGAEQLHEEIAGRRAKPATVHAIKARLSAINQQVRSEEDQFSATLAEASRRANDSLRMLSYALATVFVALGILLSASIIKGIRRTEEALIDSEKRYRSIFETVGDAIYTIASDGRLTSVSPSCERMTGWSPADLVGKPFAAVVHPDDLPRAKETFQQTLAGQSTTSIELRLNMKAGQYLDAEHSVVPLGGGDGAMAVLGIARDISERKRLHASAERERIRFQTILRMASDGIHILDRDGLLVEANEAFLKMLGYDASVIGHLRLTDWDALEVPWEAVKRHIADLIEKQERTVIETRQRRRDGTILDVEINACGIEIEGEGYLYAASRNISERKRVEEQLRIAATAFEAQEGLVITDANCVILRVNQAFTDVTGYAADEVIGRKTSLLKSGRHDAVFYGEMWEHIQRSGSWQGEIWNKRKNGEVFPEWLTITAVKGDAKQVTHFVGTLTDITLRKAAEEEIRRLAFYDPLTHLPNRRLLLDRLQQVVASSTRNGLTGALLFVDLDNFKVLNDTLGHDIGDLLLQQVAQRLSTCVREGDTVARLGGDEFIVMLKDLSKDSREATVQTEVVGEKILAVLNQPYVLARHQYDISGSIGATLFGGHPESVDEILKRADVAMYQAKAAGRNTMQFSPSDT